MKLLPRLLIIVTAMIAFAAAPAPAVSQPDAGPALPWLELQGVHGYTGYDGGDATTLTVCSSAQAYTKWADGVAASAQQCAKKPRGVPVTIASNEIVGVDWGSLGSEYVVFVRADDSSWAGWTSTVIGLQPRIPKSTKLIVESSG